ncbi:MAG: orotate phosphoribosyltransferase [Pyrobaculum sp.]
MIQRLVERGVVRFGKFRLSSGLESPFYVDLRGVLGDPDLLRWVVERYLAVLSRLEFDAVLGVATGGIPYASILGYLLGRPVGYVRVEEKGYGTGRRVEGVDVAGRRAVVVDDVLTTGRSVLSAVNAVRAAGGAVVGVVVFLDREQCGADAVRREAGVDVYSVYRMRELLEELRPYIGEERSRSVLEYLSQWRC